MKAEHNIFRLAIRREKPQHGGKNSVKWYEELQVDSVPLKPYHCLDYIALVKSMCLDGEHYFFTCGCGEPGCSGIHSGVQIRHQNGLIYWHSAEPGPERNYVFATPQYRRSIGEALRFVGKTVTGGNEFPIGTLDFTRTKFRRALAAAELACQLDEPGSAHGKIFNQFTEAMENIWRRD
jgi:hypothetical protein